MKKPRRSQRTILPGCRADCMIPRLLRTPLPLASNRPIRNISRSGVSIIGLGILPKDTLLQIQILAGRYAPTLQLLGHVRWAEERMNEEGRSISLTGVEFVNLDKDSRRQLEKLLQWRRKKSRKVNRVHSPSRSGSRLLRIVPAAAG